MFPRQAQVSSDNSPQVSEKSISKQKELEDVAAETLRLVIDSVDEKMVLESLDSFQKKQFTEQIYDTLVAHLEEKNRHLSQSDKQKVIHYVYDEMFGYGPINSLIQDPSVTEVMVNGFENVFVEKNGKIVETGITFRDNDHILHIINKIISPLGRRIDESSPTVDARLADGSRVNAIIAPLSVTGPILTIRKFATDPFKREDLLELGTMTEEMADFLRACVRARANIIVSGGTGSGKTTTLNVLSSFIPDAERIVTIEDTAELQLRQGHVITLESRSANIEGKGEFSIRELVRNCLRMRPDRIVVGEVRGGETLDMLQAMNTGHDGSISTLHANNPRDALTRMETMVLMAGMELPLKAIREQLASSINLIIQQSRLKDGTRKIVRISEVVGMEKDFVAIKDIFAFKQSGIDVDGNVVGEHQVTGVVPKFLENLREYGEDFTLPQWEEKLEEAALETEGKTEDGSEGVAAAGQGEETDRQPTREKVMEAGSQLIKEATKEAEETAAGETEEIPAELGTKSAETETAAAPVRLVREEPVINMLQAEWDIEAEIVVPEYTELENVVEEEVWVDCDAALEDYEEVHSEITEEGCGQALEKVAAEVAEEGMVVETAPRYEISCQGPDLAEVGQNLVWSVSVSNQSEQVDLVNVVVAGSKFETTRELEILPAGGSHTFEIAYRVPAEDYPRIENSIMVSASNREGEESTLEGICETRVMRAKLEVSNTGPEKAAVGETIAYTIVVRNPSSEVDLNNVVITDSKQDWSQRIDALPAGQSQTYVANYTVIKEDAPVLESVVTVRGENRYAETIIGEDKHNVSVEHYEIEEEMPEERPAIDRDVEEVERRELTQEAAPREREEREERSLTSLIPENMRGMTLRLRDVTGMFEFIRPGDRVDVLVLNSADELDGKGAIQTMAQDAIFLAERDEAQGDGGLKTIALAVTPSQAEALVYAAHLNLKGSASFHLTLRSNSEEKKIKKLWKNRLAAGE